MEIPNHVAIIMDGNGRWARSKHLPRVIGHKRGVDRVRDVLQEAKDMGVKILTLFAFSTENWSRPKKEIQVIFSYLERHLDQDKGMLIKEGIRFNVFGRRDRISKSLLNKIEEVESLTENCKSLVLNVALDYGGRWEIVEATKKVAKDILEKKISLPKIDEHSFPRYLSLTGFPDPDFLIRTSGELRISNFLLWQLAYAEFYFPKVFWPDFDKKLFRKAIEEYVRRKRRFGALDL